MRSDGCVYSVGKGGSTENEIPESGWDLMAKLSIILINHKCTERTEVR